MRVLVAAMMVLTVLSGCLTATDEYYDFDPDEHYRNPVVWEGTYSQGGGGSLLLTRGNLTPFGPEVVRLISDTPAYSGAVPTADAQVDIVMAIWRPENVTEPVPIIVDAGPYFEVGCQIVMDPCPPDQTVTIDDPEQTTPFSLQNYLPHGYAVVQIGVRGTGSSGGCMDLLGPEEAADLNQAINWLGEQEWSSGAIGMIGASYDGSTPWEVAASGNQYLKTIVPTSGLPDIYDLMFRNGTAETRGPIMHNGVYWGYGFSTDFPQRPDNLPEGAPWVDPIGNGQANDRQEYQDRQNLLCPEVVEATAMGQYTTVSGHRGAEASTYWAERDYRQRVLDNYNGSVFLIHGLQDWNVDPHAAIPFNQELEDAGLKVMNWYGQWGHAFPDSTCIADAPEWAVTPCRLDFGEVLFRWFESELKGNTTLPQQPLTQVQDNLGFWRYTDSYPPRDPDWLELQLNANGKLSAEPGSAETVLLSPPSNGRPTDVLEFVSEPFEEGLQISGLPQLRVPFSVEGQGGHLAAWLFDMDPDGEVRAKMAAIRVHPQDQNRTEWYPGGVPVVGYSAMNLLYYGGGEDPQPVAPATRYVARMQFEPLEVQIPAGHRLALWVFQHTYEDHQDSSTPARVNVHLDADAILRLSTVEVDPRTVFPVPGANYLNRTYVSQMYVPMPGLQAGYQEMHHFGAIPTLEEIQAWKNAESLGIVEPPKRSLIGGLG